MLDICTTLLDRKRTEPYLLSLLGWDLYSNSIFHVKNGTWNGCFCVRDVSQFNFRVLCADRAYFICVVILRDIDCLFSKHSDTLMCVFHTLLRKNSSRRSYSWWGGSSWRSQACVNLVYFYVIWPIWGENDCGEEGKEIRIGPQIFFSKKISVQWKGDSQENKQYPLLHSPVTGLTVKRKCRVKLAPAGTLPIATFLWLRASSVLHLAYRHTHIDYIHNTHTHMMVFPSKCWTVWYN